jgi:hypothetical protein
MILHRKSDVFFCFLILGVLVLGLMFVDAAVSRRLDEKLVRERRAIVRVLTLTDLCLSTEARYTRHPSLADRHTPFQDHPLSLDHFPSGAVMAPPPHLSSRDGGK